MRIFDVVDVARGVQSVAEGESLSTQIRVVTSVGMNVSRTVLGHMNDLGRVLDRSQLPRQFDADDDETVLPSLPDEEHFEKELREHFRDEFVSSVDSVRRALASAELPKRFHDRLDRIEALVKRPVFKAVVAKTLFGEMAHDLLAELSEPLFLRIDLRCRDLYEQKSPPFGPFVESKFPDSTRDIAAAARCLALDEWTACVIHLMRALESPLHTLAGKVGVVFPSPLDLENWKNIIDKIESTVIAEEKRLEQVKKSHERNSELKALGESVLQFRHFKNAWRNNAAHGREHYDERDALVVFDAVKSFMQHLAMAL